MLKSLNARHFCLFIVFIALAAGALLWALNVARNAQPVMPPVSFTNLQGQKISSEQLRGKVVMVNFWATSCSTCVAEMPDMVRTYQKYHDKGLEFIAVAMQYDPPNYVLNFTETRQLPFQVALDVDGGLAKAFDGVRMTPTTFVIDKKGKILKRYMGQPSMEELHKILETALKA